MTTFALTFIATPQRSQRNFPSNQLFIGLGAKLDLTRHYPFRFQKGDFVDLWADFESHEGPNPDPPILFFLFDPLPESPENIASPHSPFDRDLTEALRSGVTGTYVEDKRKWHFGTYEMTQIGTEYTFKTTLKLGTKTWVIDPEMNVDPPDQDELEDCRDQES